MVPGADLELLKEARADAQPLALVTHQLEGRLARVHLQCPATPVLLRINLADDYNIVFALRLVHPHRHRKWLIRSKVVDIRQFEPGISAEVQRLGRGCRAFTHCDSFRQRHGRRLTRLPHLRFTAKFKRKQF